VRVSKRCQWKYSVEIFLGRSALASVDLVWVRGENAWVLSLVDAYLVEALGGVRQSSSSRGRSRRSSPGPPGGSSRGVVGHLVAVPKVDDVGFQGGYVHAGVGVPPHALLSKLATAGRARASFGSPSSFSPRPPARFELGRSLERRRCNAVARPGPAGDPCAARFGRGDGPCGAGRRGASSP